MLEESEEKLHAARPLLAHNLFSALLETVDEAIQVIETDLISGVRVLGSGSWDRGGREVTVR
jgi:hypothetical protein